MANLFFSYSSRDRPLAQRLVAKLSDLGHRISIDTDSLVPGVEWRREQGFRAGRRLSPADISKSGKESPY